MATSSKELQIFELKDMISQLNTTIKMLNDTIVKQQAQNEQLQSEVAWFKHKYFGSSSERTVGFPGQLNLFDESMEEEPPVEFIEPEIIPVTKKPRKKKPTLEQQFKDIPTKEVLVDTLSDEDKTCAICGTQMVAIGKEYLRTEIVYTPPKLERIEYYGTNYTCPQCKETEEPYFVKDKGTPALFEGSYVSESLLAYIIYRKFGLYIPLYRQEKDFAQQNAPIGRTSMAHWVILSSQ